MVDISIIIVNWNLQDLLEQCLNSIYQNLHNINFEVFVVDNNSSDNSVEMIKRKFPTVTLVANKENIGFSRANNQAIRRSKGEYILLLNPDTIIVGNAIQNMLNHMRKNKKIGALGPKVVDSDNTIQPGCVREYPSILNEFCKLMRFDRFFLNINNRLFSRSTIHKTKFNTKREVKVLSGSCMFLRSECVKEINGFDEQFFLYGEDVDLCYRIRQKGWLVYYLPEATVTHYAHRASEKSLEFSPFAVSCCSMYKYFKKNSSRVKAALYRIMVAFTSFFWIIIYTITFRFLRKRPLNKLNIYHDFFKLRWALTSKI